MRFRTRLLLGNLWLRACVLGPFGNHNTTVHLHVNVGFELRKTKYMR
jgi:hypothetical protein